MHVSDGFRVTHSTRCHGVWVTDIPWHSPKSEIDVILITDDYSFVEIIMQYSCSINRKKSSEPNCQ